MPERFRGELLTVGRYTNPAFFYLYPSPHSRDMPLNKIEVAYDTMMMMMTVI